MSVGADVDLAELAGEMYDQAYKAVKRGEFMEQMLALHIVSVLDYYGEYGMPLWKVRVLPTDGKRVILDKFDDYLFLQPRDGLGLPKSYLWLYRVITAHVNKKEREDALSALRAEIKDFDGKVDGERLAERNAAEPARKPGGNNNPAGKNQHTKDVPSDLVDLVASVEPAKRVVGSASGQVANSHLSNKASKASQKSSTSPERVIARLKRDMATDTKAAEVFKRVESAEISPRAAAKEMGWTAPTKTIPVSEPRKAIEALMKVWSWDEIYAALQEVKR